VMSFPANLKMQIRLIKKKALPRKSLKDLKPKKKLFALQKFYLI
jgi:hypothetical protein